MMHDYYIYIRQNGWKFHNGWRLVGAGSINLKTVYPDLQFIAKRFNYHGLMMVQQTYTSKKIYFVV